jgi:hypothetical protein
MRKRAVTTLALATLLALVLTGHAATSRAQDVINVRNLSVGCNMVTATFPTGTPASALADAMSPPTALQAVWRVDNATHSFQAFMPQAPQASDLTSLNLLDPLFVCVGAAATISLPVPDLDPESPPISVSLSTGCNAVGLTFSDPEGVVPSDVAAAVTPAGALQSIWRLDNVTHTFQAYVAAAPQASDLTSLQFLDAVFVCTGGPATLSMPAVTEPAGRAVQPPPPAGTGEEAVRYIMEGAVPQAVDLPQGFVALGEDFMSLDGSPGMPPGGQYLYTIAYADPLGIILPTPSTLVFAAFEVALFDTAEHARSFMKEQTEMSADERRALVEPRLAGSYGIEIGSFTVEDVEPLAGVGDEADFVRVRMQVRSIGTNDLFLPVSEDLYTIRRDSVVAQVTADWALGPPGPTFVTENLAKKMDAGIQAALPQLQAAVP